MSDTDLFPKHGLSGNTAQCVFDALYQKQEGRCFICGYEAKLHPRHRYQSLRRLLYIDHCHTTGMIRGLLCFGCNYHLGLVEGIGLKPKPETIRTLDRSGKVIKEEPYPEELYIKECEEAGWWLGQYQDIVLEYMQMERWLPRKDILFHLQGVSK